jgi:8-oxo-dGTP diphosphatase
MSQSVTTKRVTVAAAVIERADGTYLLGRRAPGTFFAGYWEFPGGKVEAGETPHDAIVRELDEELGITVQRADPWLRREHVYEHAHVDLHFFRVREWSGEMVDRVHDALSWQRPGEESVAPMLPANAPVLASLRLPPHYAITHAAEIGIAAQLAQLDAALTRGLRLVLLREPGLSAAQRVEFYAQAIARCHAQGARVLVHDEAELAVRLGADGVHWPARRLAGGLDRAGLALMAASCHSVDELRMAAKFGCDFTVYGPVCETASHPGQSGMGWAQFAAQIAVPPALTYALGGLSLDPGDLDDARRAGAQGVAGIRAFW